MEKRKKYRESIGRTTVPPGNLAEQIQYGKPTTQMWRTPDAHCDRGPSSEERMKKKLDKGMPISLNDQVKHPNLMWPTPRAKEPGRTTKGFGRGLAELVEGKQQLWPTPSAGMHKQDVNDDGRYARDIKEKGYQVMLPAAVKLWPTPRARDYKDGESVPPSRVKKPSLATLGQSVRMWPTPRAALGMSMRLTENMAKLRHKKYLETEVAYHEHKSKAPGTGGGTLNPTWVEWLMGYPLGHTDLKD
jgi:DNA (cytosine-5)-methyltransferase 1